MEAGSALQRLVFRHDLRDDGDLLIGQIHTALPHIACPAAGQLGYRFDGGVAVAAAVDNPVKEVDAPLAFYDLVSVPCS